MIRLRSVHPPAWAAFATAVALVMSATGCNASLDERLRTCQQQVDALTQETSQLEQQLLTRDRRIADFEQQVETLQGLGPDRVKALFVVDRIELASLTGGADYDDIPGDDGVTVYLRPLDADGHILKAAGEIIIELLDVSVPGQPRSLGRYVYNDPAELRKLWHGRFLTNHYTIRCPWDPAIGPPTRREVVVNATFYDFLTGKRLTATQAVEVDLPGSGGADRR
jgi:hypothetical protein